MTPILDFPSPGEAVRNALSFAFYSDDRLSSQSLLSFSFSFFLLYRIKDFFTEFFFQTNDLLSRKQRFCEEKKIKRRKNKQEHDLHWPIIEAKISAWISEIYFYTLYIIYLSTYHYLLKYAFIAFKKFFFFTVQYLVICFLYLLRDTYI